MPQWDFLDFLADAGASATPDFQLRMQTEATGLIEEHGRVVGVRARTPTADSDIRADLVVGADGRHSIVRERAGLAVENLGAPIDVLVDAAVEASPATRTRRSAASMPAHILVMLDRGDYWQCAFVIPKGGFDELQRRRHRAFRDAHRGDRCRCCAIASASCEDWDDVKLLTVPSTGCGAGIARACCASAMRRTRCRRSAASASTSRFRMRWRPPICWRSRLRRGRLTLRNLEAVQERRMLPTRVTQWLQVQIQNNFLSRVLASRTAPAPPLPVRWLDGCPYLRRLPARLIGVGIRPEHVQTQPLLAPR